MDFLLVHILKIYLHILNGRQQEVTEGYMDQNLKIIGVKTWRDLAQGRYECWRGG